jgi:deazaflavin-dependent oxidoreductase (nitroreductase family)
MSQKNSPLMRFFVRQMGRLHIAMFRATGGRLGGTMLGAPCVLVTTTGRKSGQARTTPLLYGRDGDDVIIVASFGGQPQHPDWYNNLVANPRVKVELKGATEERVARTATADEKARLWPMMVALYKGYEGYQKKTTRDIPIVILSRA